MGPAALDDGGAAAPPLPGRVPGQDPGMWHRPDHAGAAPGGVEAALPTGGPAVRGAGGLHGPRGPPRGRGRRRGPRRRPAGHRPGARSGRQQGGAHGGGLLHTLRRTRASLAVPGTALQGVVHTERRPWETADPAVVDPAPPGHILHLVWERLPDDDDRETAELPDVDPAPLDPVPATVRVVCVLDPAVLADADVRRLHVGAFGKDHAWWHLRPLMGAALPHRPPMQAVIRGSMVEVSTDLPSSVAPLVMRASGKPRGLHFRPWIVTGAACQHPAYVLWFKQPAERRGPSPQVWKTLAEDGELRSTFAGLVDGGAPGNVGVRVWGAKPADPKVVAHLANLLGAPAPAQTTSVRVRGYPAQSGLAVDGYAQLRRYAREAFGPEAPIRVHRCTQLAHSTLDRPVFDLELEGVPGDWQGVRLGAPDTRLPDRTRERTTRASRQ